MKINFFKEKQNHWAPYNLAIFKVSAILFMLLFSAEYFIPGFVTSWFNPIWFLIVASISGILSTIED